MLNNQLSALKWAVFLYIFNFSLLFRDYFEFDLTWFTDESP